MTTHGHFYRRYSGGSGSSRSTAADSSARSLSASIEPSTCGTSWNSVRWNKPINLGFTHSSRISAMFNKPSTSTSSTTHSGGSSYSAPPAQRRPYKPLDTLTSHHGSFRNTQTPSFVHSTRASRDVPYRTRDSSREILSPKYTSGREVNDVPEKKCSYRSYYWHEPIKPVGVVKLMTIREDNSYLKSRMSLSAPRDLYSTSTSRYSPRNSDVPTSARLTAAATDSSRSGRSLSAFATTTPSTARLMSPPKAERPWRQKLAESARLRNLHGDEVANAIGPKIAAHRANRRNSLTRNSENELETSLTALKSLVNMDKASPLSKYREKTGSAALSSYVSAAPFSFKTEAKPRMAESFNEGALAAAKLAMKQEENGPMTQSCAPLGSSSTLLANGLGTPSENNGQSLESVNAIPLVPDEMTSSVTRRRRSPSARTARRQSRQRSLSKSQSRKPSSSSSEAEAANGPREPPRVKRLKKKKSMQSQESLNGPAPETVKPVDDLLPAPTTSPPIRAEPAVVVEKETAVEPTPPLPEPQPKSSAQTKTPVPKTPSSPKIGPKAFQGKAAETAKTASAKSSPVLPKKTVPTAKQNGVAAEKPKTVATKKPASPKMVKKEMVKPVEVKKETVAKEPPKVEPVKAEAKKIEPAKTETKTLEPAKVEAKKVEKLEPKAKAVEEPSKTSNGPSAAKVAPKIDGVAKFVPKKAASTKPASPKTAKKVVNGKGPAAKAENVTEDEGKYSAVAHFIPLSMRKKEEKQPAPVPGTWKGPQAELYISHNKHLTKSDMTAKAEGTMKARPAMAIKSPKIKVPVKKKPPPVVTKSVLKTLTAKTANQTQRCLVNIPPQERAIATHTFKLKEKEPKKVLKETASATVSAELNASCKPLLKTDKTIKQPGKQVEKISFACTASKVATTEMSKELKRKAVTAGAKVTVLASIPLLDINIARLAMKFKVPQATKQYFTNLIEKQTAIIEDEKKKFIEAPKVDLDDVQSKAQKMLQRMREGFEDENCYASNDHLPSVNYRPGEPIVLPDQSLLEEYVRRKRGKLERLQRGASVDSSSVVSDSSACDTPSIRSTTSELLPACAVRVVEPPQKSLPLITTPSRSRLSSVEKAQFTPPPKDADMLELLQYGEQVFNANGGVFRAPLRKAQRSASLTKSIFFDTPLTPFEERMQSQAHALRKTNIRLDDSSDTSVDVTMQLPQNKRHSASEVGDNQKMTLCGVAQTFTNAAALAQQPRHERYAAHIPIHRSASSTVASSSGGGGQDGRQSTTSMESANSAILDTASKQLDQMIDQARYRHHQHRSKFKEAIDYLDQIFEDLKRECDHSNEPQKVAQKGQQAQPQPQPQQQQAQKIVQQQKNREPPQQRAAPARRNPQPYQQRFLQEHQPQPVVYTHPIKPAPKQNGNAFTANAEVEVSETIVLPPKKVNSEKMDFTRKWLDGDTKMWTGSEPKPDLILGRDDQCESDERSIGSCSAEVAAINASDRQKKQRMRETPDLIQNVTNGGQKRRKQPQSQQHHLHQQQQQPQQQLPAPVRPQPCRPQPTYAIPTTSSLSGSSGQLNITPYSSFSACHPIKRVPSQDQFSHYGSLHSEDRYQPDKSGSAFLQYKQQNTRGSIQSLPDAGLMKIRKPDLMSIDALVAELELNTDEQGNGSRRSFPVNEEGNRPQPKFNTNIDYEEPKHMKMNRLGHLNGHVMNGSGNHTQVGSVDRGMRRLRQRQQENLDDVTHHMLNNAATDFGASTAGSRPRPYHRAPPSAGTGLTPFETINTERLNPSKVNAIQSMFEAKKSEAPTSHPPPQWRRNVVHPNANPQQVPKEEDTYYEINEFCTRGDRKGSLKQQSKAATSKTGQETGPLYPLTQPPAYPPGGNSSTNSSHHGYYSSSSPPSAAPNRHSRQGSFQGSVGGTEGRKHSMVSSRATSFDEEDDGFYDNIVTTADNRRHSRISDMDNTSLMSHRLPPASAAPQQQSKSGRFGQFLQKIGGPWSRPPTSASSLMSLNKMSVDGAAKRGGGGQLMKSNSLSNEPWNSQIISASRSSTPDQKRNGSSNHGSVGLGQRLKSSFFGSRKRLN